VASAWRTTARAIPSSPWYSSFIQALALVADRRRVALAGGATALRDLEHPSCDAARALPHLLAEPLQRAREDSDPIGQQRGVGGRVNVSLDDGRIDPQAAATDDPPRPAQRDQLCQQVPEDRLVEQVGQADQRLGIGHTLAVDPAEGSVHQAPAHFPLALVEAPVLQVLKDKHPQHNSPGRAQATPAPTLRMASRKGLRQPIDEALVFEQRVDPAKGGIPEFVGVRQEHFDETALLVRSPHHGASGEAGPPQRLHRVSCAAARAAASRGSLTIAWYASARQTHSGHSDAIMARGPRKRGPRSVQFSPESS
jgi:hypothetical protein